MPTAQAMAPQPTGLTSRQTAPRAANTTLATEMLLGVMPASAIRRASRWMKGLPRALMGRRLASAVSMPTVAVSRPEAAWTTHPAWLTWRVAVSLGNGSSLDMAETGR